jgi:hypothetical protein
MITYRLKYPEKSKKQKNLASGLKSVVICNHLHHWNYNIAFAKDVIRLKPKHHATNRS